MSGRPAADGPARADAWKLKRERADEDTVRARLFALFAACEYYSLAQLVAATQQPATHLRAVLATIAEKGTAELADKWHLRPEYRAS